MTDQSQPPATESRESWREAIHRRGLWQVTAGFLAGGWALLEVVDMLVGNEILPATVFRGALILLAVGFPVVLGTAYVQSPPGPDGVDDPDSIVPRGMARWLTWRNAGLGGVGALALLGLFTVTSGLMRATGMSGEDSAALVNADHIAVLPFEVSGSPDLGYLREGIADLLSTHLDGTGALTTVDPRIVIAGIGRDEIDATDPVAASSYVASLGAGRFVSGTLIESAGRIRLSAHLHETEEVGGSRRTTTVEGAADSVFVLLDGLVARLLAEISTSDGDPLPAIAATTSHSLEAVKAYLQGERELRSGMYREAAASYEEAVNLDSTFALGHYRRTIAADWVDAFDVRSSADAAMRHADRLSPRLQGLLEGVWLHRQGRVEEAESAFQSHLHAYPDDVEALVQYGETLFHDIGRMGRSPLESMDPFARALELEPSNIIAIAHLARMYALVDSGPALADLSDRIRRVAPDGEHAAEVHGLLASVERDTVLAARIAADLEGTPWFYRFYPSYAVHGYGRDPRMALRLLSDGPPHQVLDLVRLKAELALGHRAASRGILANSGRGEDPGWVMLEALLATGDVLPADSARLETLLSVLESTDGEAILRATWVPAYEDITPRFAEYERDWFRSLLLLELRRPAEARAILADLRARDDFPFLGSVKTDAESSLEAFLRMEAGDRVGALEALRDMELQVPHAVTIRMIADQSRARFLRAELEAELGDPEVAVAFYRSLDEAWSPWDNFYRPYIYERLGRLAEGDGRPDKAIDWYNRFVDMWEDADAELAEQRDEVAGRLAALVRARG